MTQPLPSPIEALARQVEAADDLSPADARRMLQDAAIDAADLEPWADYDHPRSDSYGRRLLYDGGFFELMVMSWVDGDMAAIHDHGSTQWGAVRLFGQAEHAVFRCEDGVLATADRRQLPPGTVLAVSHDLIHQMGNVGQEPFHTLHLYGCHGCEGQVTGDARIYELDENRIHRTSGGAFYGLPGPGREPGPKSDFPTLLRHKVELLKRLLTASGGWELGTFGSEREERLAREITAAATWQRLAEEWQEVESGPGHEASRYCEVLFQEIRATAALQRRLAGTGLLLPPFNPTRLDEILACASLEDLACAYLELMSSTYDLVLPGLVLA
jgi:predicted metal-dependent enzyme (double-stranded beta helix superfamily)